MPLPVLLVSLVLFSVWAPAPAQDYERPEQGKAWWWDTDWWETGQLDRPENHPVRTEWVEYTNDDVTVPTLVARPDDAKAYPGVLFQHGRRGLDELVQGHARRLAARGFTVVAPDGFSARFIERFPIRHDPATESDVDAGVDYVLSRPDVSGEQICLYSHTRGGYYTLRVAVTFERQANEVACYVSYYPHMQNPNAPEPMQVYRYAPEADRMRIPTLIFIGEDEQYQRKRGIEMAVASMQDKGYPVRLVTYPGVGRGFDFRPRSVRSFADDLASKDALQRAARFMRRHVGE